MSGGLDEQKKNKKCPFAKEMQDNARLDVTLAPEDPTEEVESWGDSMFLLVFL